MSKRVAGPPEASIAPEGLEPAAPKLLEQLWTGDRGEASREPRPARPREAHEVASVGADAFMPQGTVYGVLLNFRNEMDLLAPQMHQVPYKAAPKAPVLYVKTANTWSPHGAAIAIPTGVAEVEVGATIAMVMGKAGTVQGYVLMNDLSIPHNSFFRPPVKFKNLDGFLGIGERLIRAEEAGNPLAFTLEVRINGQLKQSVDFSQLLRPAALLLADVGEFMTLQPGDVLMLGCDAGRPLAQVGDRIDITAPAFGTLSNPLVAEAS